MSLRAIEPLVAVGRVAVRGALVVGRGAVSRASDGGVDRGPLRESFIGVFDRGPLGESLVGPFVGAPREPFFGRLGRTVSEPCVVGFDGAPLREWFANAFEGVPRGSFVAERDPPLRSPVDARDRAPCESLVAFLDRGVLCDSFIRPVDRGVPRGSVFAFFGREALLGPFACAAPRPLPVAGACVDGALREAARGDAAPLSESHTRGGGCPSGGGGIDPPRTAATMSAT